MDLFHWFLRNKDDLKQVNFSNLLRFLLNVTWLLTLRKSNNKFFGLTCNSIYKWEFLFCFAWFFATVSLPNLAWCGTSCVDQAGLFLIAYPKFCLLWISRHSIKMLYFLTFLTATDINGTDINKELKLEIND